MWLLEKLWNYSALTYRVYNYYNSYSVHKTHDDTLIDPILHSVFKCGSVCIKFCQWIIPNLEILYIEDNQLFDLAYEKPLWIKKLSRVFEDCPEHSLKYTYEEYERVFGTTLTKDYRIIECIGSGSIGQVYKIQNIRNEKYYAMKVLHPHIDSEVNLFERLYTLIHGAICMYLRVHNYIPFNIPVFINGFREQSNFVNEANNLLKMKETYSENPYLVFPDIIRVSKSILIMEYVNGNTLETIPDCSEYLRGKIFTMFYLFVRDMILIRNFNHGDLHPSNWNVRLTPDLDIGFQIIIYDFGYCWSMAEDRIGFVFKSTDLFETINGTLDQREIRLLSEIFYEAIEHDHISDKDALKQSISEYMDTSPLVGSSDSILVTPTTIYRVVSEYCYHHNLRITSELIQYVIVYTQLHITCARYGYSAIQGIIHKDVVYKERYIHCLNFCKTYNIYPEYCHYINTKLNEMKPFRKELFDTDELSHDKDFLDALQDLALS